jgi:phage terminase small subunit
MGVPKRLTEMQKRFAEFVVFGGPDGPVSQSEAAVLAGYSPKRSRQEGSELMNPRLSPLVAQYLGKLKEERLKKFEVNYENHVAELARIKEMALKKGSFSSAVNAETNRGKAAGLYIDRKIIKTGKLEDMSEEELELKMKQILDDYAPLLKAQTVEGEAIEAPKSSESSEPTDVVSSSDPQKKKNHHLPDQKKQKV